MKLSRMATIVAATAALVVAIAPMAKAADPTDVTVTGGTLGITTPPTVANFGAITLNGTAQTTTAAMDAFEVNDARGTGEGWNVTVQATRFAEHDGTAYVASGRQLPASSLTMPAPSVAADGTTSPDPTVTGGPYTVDSGTAVKIASAAVDQGMGKYDFTQGGNLSLSVPANAYAKTYRSDVTVSTVTGP